MARLRKYASRDRLGDPQVIDKAAFFDPNRQNLHQKDDYPDVGTTSARVCPLFRGVGRELDSAMRSRSLERGVGRCGRDAP